jgi:hypothetical protein
VGRAWRRFALVAASAVLVACGQPVPTRSPSTVSPAPTPSVSAAPAPVASPAPATITVEANGRYRCDWVVGCAPYLAIVSSDDPWGDDLAFDDPADPILLDQRPIPDADQVFEVEGPSAQPPTLPAGTYRLTAGWLWVDDVATAGPDGRYPFLGTGEVGPCVAALVVGEATEQASIAITFHESARCDLTIHAGSGARLDVQMAGTVNCVQFPYSCAATVSVLPEGAIVDDDWRPPATDPWWGAASPSADHLSPPPIGTVPDLRAGPHRVVVSLLGQSDIPSFGPDGSLARDLLARCQLDIDVGAATERVALVVTFEPDGIGYGGACRIDQVTEP